jgi:hypothetical protein
MSVRLSPARRVVVSILSFTFIFIAAWSARFQAQSPDPWQWAGGTMLLGPLTDGSGSGSGGGIPSPSNNAVSTDGRWVVFKTAVATIEPDGWDTNGVDDVFLLDRQSNFAGRVSFSSFSGNGEANGPSDYPSVSADGRFVTFASAATNLVPDDTNGHWDVFVFDRVALTTSLVSRRTNDALIDADSTYSAISADGRFVAFISDSWDLAPGLIQNGQLYVRDRDVDGNRVFDEPGKSSTTIVSVGVDGSGTPANASVLPFFDMTPDGRVVAFSTQASNLVQDDTNESVDVYVRTTDQNSRNGYILRANIGRYGAQTPAGTISSHPSLSEDGRYVVFASNAATLVNDDSNETTDIFLHDGNTGETTRVSESTSGQQGDDESGWPSISGDGRYVAFQSKARNFGGALDHSNVYVRDRELGTTTAINRNVNGGPLVDGTLPSISGDGSTVIFRVGDSSNTTAPANLYAAVDFSVTPTSIEVRGDGDLMTITVTAAPSTGWEGSSGVDWIMPINDYRHRAGSGTVEFNVGYNGDGTSRTGTVTVGPKTITVTQAAGFAVQTISPTSGTASGGTTVTIAGSGFTEGASVRFGGVPAVSTTLVSSTTLTAVTPPHGVGLVDVEVTNGDGLLGLLWGGYRYDDRTPPVITPTVTGTLGLNGWYIDNVVVTWSVTDPESAITSSTCETRTVNYDTDPPGTYFWCTATSAGGTMTGISPTIKRDGNRPWVTFDTQASTIYEPGQYATVSYTCDELHGSDIDTCGGSVPSGGTLDTSTPGMHEVTVTATDKAGWSRTDTLIYGVASGVCTAPPSDMVSWWNGDYTMADFFGSNHGSGSATYGYGLVGSAFQLSGTNSVNFGAHPSLNMTTAFSVSAWVYPIGSRWGTIFNKRGEYGLEIRQGNLNYYFGTDAGHANFVLGANSWTHVAMTYDAGALTIYVNGRPVKIATVPATLVDAVPGTDNFMVGSMQDGTSTFRGTIDEIQVYRRALTPAELESMFLSGSRGICVPAATALTVSPVSRTYAPDPDATATLTARLTSGGVGVPDRTLAFSLAGAQVGTAVTDGAGNASLTVNVANKNAGTYWITVAHQRDTSYAASSGYATMTVAKRPTTIVWAAPAPITYGTNLNSGMFNATTTETVSGSFAYTPSTIPTTPPSAGTVTLSATFTPSDTTNYSPSTASVTLQVLLATPTITFSNVGPFPYEARTYYASAMGHGVRGETWLPTFTYNGSSELPVNAGDYEVVASLAARPNYTAATATATLRILKRAPVMFVGPVSVTYDGLPHSAEGRAYGWKEMLTPVTVTYNGQTEPPVNAGRYTLVATYDGAANYEAGTTTGILEIRQANVTLTATLGYTTRLYNGAPHTIASASATGIGGEVLPVRVTYNGDTSGALNAGEYAVVVSFEETQNYAPKSLSLGTLTIVKASPKFTITGGARTVTYNGNPYVVTATAAGVFGEELAPLTITYNGSSTAATNAGDYTVLVSYGGSANYAARSASTWLMIGKAYAQLSYDPAPSLVYGQPLGPAQLIATANVPGTFTYSPAAGTVPHRGESGSIHVQATFTPNDTTNYYGGNVWRWVGVLPVVLAVKADDAVKAFGAPLPVFTASFSGFVNGDTPASLTGALAFATTATDQSPVGTYPITVGGLSSNDYIVAPIAGVLTVQPAATSTEVSSSANPSGINQPVTFTASVSAAAPAPGQPTGTVTFRNGSTVLGDAVVQNGTASLTTILATGTHAITATYAGDASFATSSSASLSQTVNASSTSTTTTVTSSRNPSKTGQSVTLTARVTSPAGTPTGDVEFLDGGVLVGTATLSGSGTATLTTTAMAVGSHAMSVRYLGSETMPPSFSATLVQVVNTSSSNVKSTTTALSASPSTGTYGTQTTFNVTVTPPLFNSAPTGSVRFTIDGVSSTVVALTTSNGKGVASLSTSALPRGKHLVTVTYLGSGTYAGSTATLTYTVN